MFSTRNRNVLNVLAGGTALAAALLGGVSSTANATPAPGRPSITSASFSGTSGPGMPSPTITLRGSGFGVNPPAGTPNNNTSCGAYTANGQVYGNQLYFIDDNNFEAGFSNSGGGDCIGVTVVSWSDTQAVLQFGNAYGTFAHWYLSNGDGYAVSVANGIWGGTVTGLR